MHSVQDHLWDPQKVLFSEYQGQCGRDIKITYINLVLKLRKVEVQLHSLTCLHGRRVKGQHYPYTTKHIQFTQLKFHTPPTLGVQTVSPETQFHKYTNLEITASRPRKPRIPKSKSLTLTNHAQSMNTVNTKIIYFIA